MREFEDFTVNYKANTRMLKKKIKRYKAEHKCLFTVCYKSICYEMLFSLFKVIN